MIFGRTKTLPGEEPGPDHIYRTYIESLPAEERLEIVNRMMVYIALHDNTFWLKDISEQMILYG